LIQIVKSSNDVMDLLVSSVLNISLGNTVPSTLPHIQEECENFVGCKISEEIQIHPPNDVRSKERSKRIKRAEKLLKPHKGKTAKNLMKEPLQ
jgi:hypothetical protein